MRYEREAGRAPTSTSRKWPAYPGGGHRALGRGCGSARGAGAACLHVAVDDFSRVAYAELLPDERKGTCAAFRAGACASSRAWACGSSARDDRQRPGLPQRRVQRAARIRGRPPCHTRAYSPWQNSKVERMNRTLAQEWQYARAWDGEAGRDFRPARLHRTLYWGSVRTACGGLPPMSHRRRKQPIGTQQLVRRSEHVDQHHTGNNERDTHD